MGNYRLGGMYMSLFKKKVKKQEPAAPAAEPKSFVIIKNAPGSLCLTRPLIFLR